MAKRDDNRAPQPDDDNPEWTKEEIRTARPAIKLIAEMFGQPVAETLTRGRGRPAKADRKINQTLRLDADVLEAYRQSGAGWQSRMNRVLREHMPSSTK